MLMNNPLVQSPGWWSLPKKKRFEMASAQSMLSPLAQVQTPQYDYTMGASAGSATGKKSSWVDRLVSAAGKLKLPAGQDFDRMAGVVGRNPKVQFNLMGGLHPSYDYSFGGLNEDVLKRQRKIYGSLV